MIESGAHSEIEIKLGLVGAGQSGLAYGRACERLKSCSLSAVCDSKPERAAAIAGAKPFRELDDLLGFPELDALIVATGVDHRSEIALQALGHGLSVLLESPVSSDQTIAREMASLVAKSRGKLVCGVSKPHRLSGRGRKLKELTDGAFGRPHRMQWTLTDRFCPEFRVTSLDQERVGSQGELTVQLGEELDFLLWLLGEPEEVEAFQCLGKHHDVEVEDEVFFRFAWDDGATGSVIASSGEIPCIDRLELVGDHGLIVSEKDTLIKWDRSETSVEEFSRSIEESSIALPLWNIEIPIEDTDAECLLEAVVFDFSEAIRLGGKPVAGPEDDMKLLRLHERIARSVGNR